MCQQFGYAGASQTDFIDTTPGATQYFRLKQFWNSTDSFLTQLEKTDTCDKLVQITCQEFGKFKSSAFLETIHSMSSTGCGSHSSLDGQSARIVGGSSATDTQWPSVVLLYNKKLNVQCTGSLITPLWALAGYSCLKGSSNAITAQDWTVYAGGTRIFPLSSNGSVHVIPVSNVVSHPQVSLLK